ncbi:hypothetical protein B7486_10935 [cyanobacterium TDX16]|nr:hypothetical protein B7486_10935 [cyanobacterium TDX16]
MCTYVFVTLPKDIDLAPVQAALKPYRFKFSAESNLPPEDLRRSCTVGRITQAQCDCGTVVGMGADRVEKEESDRMNDQNRHIDKLRRKGWSEAKIARWKTQTDANLSYTHAQRHLECESRSEEAETWANALRAVASFIGNRPVGLYHYWAGGRRATVQETREYRISQLTGEAIINASERVHHIFVP